MADQRGVAVVGCGFFSPNHIHAWRELPGARIVAVCDLDSGRAEAAAALAGHVPWYTDADQMLRDCKPDVADIVTTAPSHLALVRLCAEHGVAAIIQKPLASTLSEAASIARVATEAGLPVMVHENFRFQQPIRTVKMLLNADDIGRPVYCSVKFRCGYDVIAGQPYLAHAERFVLMDMGVHILDVARFLMGEIETVSCASMSVRSGIRGEDMATALLKFESGAIGVAEQSYSSFLPDDPFPETLITIEGTRGAIVLERNYVIRVRSGSQVRTLSVEPEPPAWAERPWHVVQDSVLATCRHWLESSARGAAFETSAYDNLRTIAAVEACYRSLAKGGAPVRPAELLEALEAKPGALALGTNTLGSAVGEVKR